MSKNKNKINIILFYRLIYNEKINEKITIHVYNSFDTPPNKPNKIRYNNYDLVNTINNDKSIFKLGKVEDNKFYEWISYNKFKKTSEELPKLEQIAIPSKLVNKYLCGDNKNMTKDVQEIKNNEYHIFGLYYNVLNNYADDIYLMSIIGKKVLIFKKDKKIKFKNTIIEYYFSNYLYTLRYNIKIKKYFPKQIFTNISKLSDNYHSILLHLSNNKYLYMDYRYCYEFISYDLITKFGKTPDQKNTIAYAIDKLNNYYLFKQDGDIVMTDNNINTSPEKLYELYNFKRKIFIRKLSYWNKLFKKTFIKNFQQINKIYQNNEEKSLFLNTHGLIYEFLFYKTTPLSILKLDGSKEILDYKKYMKLMQNYANLVGIKKIKPIWITNTFSELLMIYSNYYI